MRSDEAEIRTNPDIKLQFLLEKKKTATEMCLSWRCVTGAMTLVVQQLKTEKT